MARSIGKLSAIAVSKTKTKGLYSDGGGLYLRITATGARSWMFRYMIDGKAREMGLGALNAITLAEARGKAGECRKLVSQKIDPIEARKEYQSDLKLEAAKQITFKSSAESYIESHKDGWKNKKHIQQWQNTLKTYAYPVIENHPVQEVTITEVMKILEPIWKKKPETASRLRGRIESIIDWATSRGYRTGENPARWRGHLQNLLPARSKIQKVRHHPALPYAEIADFMSVLGARTDVSARALELTILTASRTSEVVKSEWSEFDLNNKVWTIPEGRMKAGREHRIPLTERTVSILREMERFRQGDFVFIGNKPNKSISNMAMLQLLRRMGHNEITTHGFRSSFRDWAAEQTHFPREVAEAALAHVIGDKTEAAYRRGDLFEKRRKLMESWEEYCYRRKTPNLLNFKAKL